MTAAEEALGWPDGTFQQAYAANRADSNGIALEAEPVVAPLIQFMAKRDRWEGPVGELHAALISSGSDFLFNSSGWPKNPQQLSAILTRLTPNLNRVGIFVTNSRTSHIRRITLTREQVA